MSALREKIDAMNYEALSTKAREVAKRHAERMYPPDMLDKRREEEEREYLRLYRSYTGADKPRITLR